MKTLTAASAIIGSILGLLICATAAAVQADDSPYGGPHRLVWMASTQSAAVALDPASFADAREVKAAWRMRELERNSQQVIDRLTRKLEARLVNAAARAR